ncbi:MAG: NlpC/P60 family protein [Bacteroidota bacterium]
MDCGICLISVAPLRALPDDRSEQVTQMLFGDLFTVLEKKEKWLLVQLVADSYQGWVSSGQVTPLAPDEMDLLLKQSQWVSNDLVQLLENKSRNHSFLVSAGSSFYDCSDQAFELAGEQWYFHGAMSPVKDFDQASVINHAMLFLHAPYQWGGKSVLGIDCSGFTQLVYKMAGKSIHRDASQQARQGEMINLIHEARPGDLLFFDDEEGNIIHTGIMLDESYIIHAHQKVRIDKIDHHGIFNVDTRKYTHQLRIIKSFR